MNGLTPRSRAYHEGPTQRADHFLYRCYDADGDLIYIGCTSNVKRRMVHHRRGIGGSRASKWLSACMVRHEVNGPFQGRNAAREFERQAIAIECPIFNTQERREPIWMTRREVSKYLVERGHAVLAAETTCYCEEADPELEYAGTTCLAHRHLRRAAA